MRIIGGEYRGIRISVPANFRARPTTDMAKESLFNILANHIDFESIDVLDLFSGTGGISFEFVSRGSGKVTLIEKNYIHYKHIVKSIEKLDAAGKIRAIKSDVFRFLEKCNEKYDVVFADPPYDLENLSEIPEKVFGSNIMKNGGMFILEHPGSYNFNRLPGFTELRKYGSVHFSFFKNK